MPEIILEGNNIEKVRKLLSFVPSEFGNVPLKFSMMNNICYASIQTLTPTISMCFSSIIQLDKINGLNEDIYVRVPMNKVFINQILSNSFDEVEISESKISANNNKKNIGISLLRLNDKDKIELPYTNSELYDSVINRNPHLEGDNILFDISEEDIKEIIDCWSVLRTADKDKLLIKVSTNDKGISFSSSDTLDSSFSYTIENNIVQNKIVSNSFDKTLADVLEKINKIKGNNLVSMLISNPLIAFTIVDEEDNYCVTVGIPAKN